MKNQSGSPRFNRIKTSLFRAGEAGAVPLLPLITIVGLIAFLVVAFAAPLKNSLLSSLFPKDQSQAATFDPATKTFGENFGDGSAPKNPDGTFAPHTPKNFSDLHWYQAMTINEDSPGAAVMPLDPVTAEMGTDCSNPPATHQLNTTIDTAVFICRDQLLTSYASGADAFIDLIPDELVDISQGTAVIKFDVSTARHSDRNWIEFALSPMSSNMTLSGVQGSYSFNTIRAFLTNSNPNPCWDVYYYNQTGQDTSLRPGSNLICNFEMQGGPMALSNIKLTRFEIRISKTHFWFGIPAGQTDVNGKPINNGQEYAFANKNISLPWDNAVFSIRHGSHNPYKDVDECFGGVCGPDTEHWDNISIAPAIPFTLVKADKRRIGPATGTTLINLASPAPTNSFLKYTAFKKPQLSVDNGASWITPIQVPFWTDPGGNPATLDGANWLGAYYVPIPAGVTQVKFRANNGGTDTSWIVRDAAVWSTTVPQSATPSPSSPISAPITPSPIASKPGDIDGNNKVDIFDYNQLLTDFGKTGNLAADIDRNGKVDIFDYNILLTNFGK